MSEPNEVSPALAAVVGGACEGTSELVARLIAESKNRVGWRPLRAAAVMLEWDSYSAGAADRVHMTRDEFAEWLDVQTFVARRRKEEVKPLEAIGMASSRKLKILNKGGVITRVEALACAHYAMRQPLPIPVGDVTAFGNWVAGAFGTTERLSHFLGMNPTLITDRIRGFYVEGGDRRPRAPEIDLIRAMDWVVRIGPFNPYGDHIPAQAFPGQTLEAAQ